MKWRVKVERAEYSDIGQVLHSLLNRRAPRTMQDAIDAIQSEIGPKYFFTRQGGAIGVHPVSLFKQKTDDALPPSVVTISPNLDRSRKWFLMQPRCIECQRAHSLYYRGAHPPFIYGYRCPREDKITIFRTDHRGWSDSGRGSVEAFPIAVAKPDRAAARQ